jgi:3-methyladenine DNA glycosylase AlkC
MGSPRGSQSRLACPQPWSAFSRRASFLPAPPPALRSTRLDFGRRRHAAWKPLSSKLAALRLHVPWPRNSVRRTSRWARHSRPSTVASGPPERSSGAAGTPVEGLANFFYYPHSSFLEALARDVVAATDCDANGVPVTPAALDRLLESNVCLTKRFTAEFSVRPLIERWPTEIIGHMASAMIRDEDADVRRLVSEGTRPRLPWGSHLTLFRKDPTPCLPLLDAIKWDTELYVRRSVANHIGDILKDNFDVGLRVCARWVDLALDGHSAAAEMERRATGAPPVALPLSVVLPRPTTKAGKKTAATPPRAKLAKDDLPRPNPEELKAVQEELLWVVRHALRNPDKNGNKLATALRQRAHVPKR